MEEHGDEVVERKQRVICEAAGTCRCGASANKVMRVPHTDPNTSVEEGYECYATVCKFCWRQGPPVQRRTIEEAIDVFMSPVSELIRGTMDWDVIDPVTKDVIAREYNIAGTKVFVAVDQEVYPGLRLGRYPDGAWNDLGWIRESIR